MFVGGGRPSRLARRRASAVLAALVAGAVLLVALTMLYQKRSHAVEQWRLRLASRRAEALARSGVEHGIHKIRRCIADLGERLRRLQREGKEPVLHFPEDDGAWLEGVAMAGLPYPGEETKGAYALRGLELRLLPAAGGDRETEAMSLSLRSEGCVVRPGRPDLIRERKHRLVLQLR